MLESYIIGAFLEMCRAVYYAAKNPGHSVCDLAWAAAQANWQYFKDIVCNTCSAAYHAVFGNVLGADTTVLSATHGSGFCADCHSAVSYYYTKASIVKTPRVSGIVTTDVAMGAWNEFIAVAGNLISVMFLFIGFCIVMRLVNQIFGTERRI
jgi:hypothetical protein